MDIIESLVQVRKEKKITQIDIANNLGVTKTTMCRYESGKREMPFSIVREYADCLGYEIRLLKK